MVVFSNYNVVSLWYTSDGTNATPTWTDVEGNLSGTAGPSIRWAEILNVGGTTHYFLGTSVGVYYTVLLDAASTVWSLEASSTIGNVVTTMLDFRSADNTLAVATHGRGVFTAEISSPLPVELVSFEGKFENNKIILDWATATEINNYGFEVERRGSSRHEATWGQIGFIEGFGNSNSPKYYSFVDENPNGSKIFQYRLKQVDFDGQYEYSEAIEINIEIGEPELFQNYPNPFNPTTTIKFKLNQSGRVKLNVYNMLGELVLRVLNQEMDEGLHEVEINASNFVSGIYIYRIDVENSYSAVKKMLFIK